MLRCAAMLLVRLFEEVASNEEGEKGGQST